MKVLVSGSSGFVGSALVKLLSGRHEVFRLLRRPASPESHDISWDPLSGKINPYALEGLDAVVHLAGDPIAGGRWTPEKKARIRDSRVIGTSLISETLARLQQPPKVLVCASAVGFYGERGDEILKEDSVSGSGFLPQTSLLWERATEPAAKKGIRVVNLRIGIVLDPAGGALRMMLPAFRLGIAGRLGSGRQYMSWIAREDVLGIMEYVLTNDALRGPVNAVAPQPVTNQEFTKTLGKVLHRPTLLPAPAFALRMIFGEMGQALLLSSTRVVPTKLLRAGYAFRYSTLEEALHSMFKS